MVQYIGIDKERYDAGNKFLSQDPYLQNYQNKAAITFNPSRSNTGIMSQYPGGKLLKIPQYGNDGGGGGGTPPGPKDLGEFTADNYGRGVADPTDMGYELTQAEQDLLDASKQGYRPGFRDIAGLALRNAFLGAGVINFGLSANSLKNKEKKFQEDIANQMSDLRAKQDFDIAMASGQSFYDNLNDGRGSTAGGVGNTAAQAAESRATAGDDPSYSGPSTFQYGGRAGYKDGYSVQDDMTDYATNVGKEASPGGGFKDSGGDGGGSPPPSYSNNESPNRFQEIERMNPAFDYAGNFGRFGGLLDLTRTIEEEEPVGNIGYLDPSNNFTIGYDTDLGTVGNANLGNFNLNHTGTGGTNLSYTDGFANNDGFYGVNFGTNTGLNLGANYAKDGLNLGANYAKDGLGLNLRFEKKFNNGGIVGMYR